MEHKHWICALAAAIKSVDGNVLITSQVGLEKALKLCKGSYQESIVLGAQCLSGADLRGKARNYGVHYALSRSEILGALHAAGLGHEMRVGHGRRVLVITDNEES